MVGIFLSLVAVGASGNVVVFEIDGRLFAKLALYDLYAASAGLQSE